VHRQSYPWFIVLLLLGLPHLQNRWRACVPSPEEVKTSKKREQEGEGRRKGGGGRGGGGGGGGEGGEGEDADGSDEVVKRYEE